MNEIDFDFEINNLNRDFNKSFESDLFDSFVCFYLAEELFNYPFRYGISINPTQNDIDNYHLIDDLKVEILSYALKFRHDNKSYSTALQHYAKAEQNFKLTNNKLIEKISKHPKSEIFSRLIEYFLLSSFAQIAYLDNNFHIATLFISQRERTMSQLLLENNLDDNLIKKAVAQHSTKAGQKGGITKGKKFAKPKKLALDYHDKYFAGKDEKGEFIYSPPKAAEKIIFELLQQGHKEINAYAVNSLANIIREHRK